MVKRALSIAILATAVASVYAATPITDPSLINTVHVIQWNAYDPDYTTGTGGNFPYGTDVASIQTTNNGTGIPDGGVMEVRTEGTSWFGVMNPGDGVLWMHNDTYLTGSVFHISFSAPVQAWAMQAQSNKFGDYVVNWGMWNGAFGSGTETWLGYGQTTGVNDALEAGTQGWIGGISDTANITDLYIGVSMADQSDTIGAGFGPLRIGTPVPEPATLAILGAGLLPFLKRRNRRA